MSGDAPRRSVCPAEPGQARGIQASPGRLWHGDYVISWTTASGRIRSKLTDLAGARRFARKWNLHLETK